jgi:hypothetical protein
LLDFALQPETVATPFLLALIAVPFSIYACNQSRDEEGKAFERALRAANEGANQQEIAQLTGGDQPETSPVEDALRGVADKTVETAAESVIRNILN